MSASLIFDLAPIGSIVAWSDGTPRPPERFRKKLAAWETRNGQGRLIRKEGPRRLGIYTSPGYFTLHQSDISSKTTTLVTIHRTFGLDSDLTFKVLERPPLGAVRIFDREAGAATQSGPVFGPRLAGCQIASLNSLPHIRPTVPDSLVGAFALVGREEVRKGDSDDRPLGIFLIPATIRAEPRVDMFVSVGRGESRHDWRCYARPRPRHRSW